MRQERIIQATIFEVFARHEIGCELKAVSQWLDSQRGLVSLVAWLAWRPGRQRRAGLSISRQPAAISLPGHIPVPQCR